MKNNKLIIGILAGILLVTVSVTFAYFAISTQNAGKGETAVVTTTTIENTVFNVEGVLEFKQVNDIYPGHKEIMGIKVSAVGGAQTIIYNLIWTGTNHIYSPIRYTIYKSDSELNVSTSCEVKEEVGIGVTKYNEECVINNESSLGSIVSSGEITHSNEPRKVILKENETIRASSEGAETYYYAVLEYPELNIPQDRDKGLNLNGVLSVEKYLGEETCGTHNVTTVLGVLAVNDCEPDFTKVSTASDTGIYEAEDDYGTSYYYRGAVENNYVKFAGFYWRIIRINGNGSLRLIYSGDVATVDGAGKETVLKNGYNDGSTKYTRTGVSVFNSVHDQAEYIGLKYTLGEKHGTSTKSTVLEQVLEPWYEANLKIYNDYIDKESGFCVDRTTYNYSTYEKTEEGGIGTTFIRFGAHMRTHIEYKPSLKCEEEQDYFTIKNSVVGNNSLEYAIGLITGDEVSLAGGEKDTDNTSYYLYTGYTSWTISPFRFYGSGVAALTVSSTGKLGYGGIQNSSGGVRPVINLKTNNTTISGSGTIASPYIVN